MAYGTQRIAKLYCPVGCGGKCDWTTMRCTNCGSKASFGVVEEDVRPGSVECVPAVPFDFGAVPRLTHKWAIPTTGPDAMPPAGWRRTRVYVSGPISKGDQAVNVHNAMSVTNELMRMGYAADCPHFSFFMQAAFPQPYERWMQRDFAFLNVVDAVLRIPGESAGGDREVAYALARGLAVYYTLDTLSGGEPVFRRDTDGMIAASEGGLYDVN